MQRVQDDSVEVVCLQDSRFKIHKKFKIQDSRFKIDTKFKIQWKGYEVQDSVAGRITGGGLTPLFWCLLLLTVGKVSFRHLQDSRFKIHKKFKIGKVSFRHHFLSDPLVPSL